MGQICFVSLFPEYFEAAMRSSIIGRAVNAGQIDWSFVQIRDFSLDKHHRVDDAPYGGGAGLVMKPEPLVAAIEHAKSLYPEGHVVLMSPQGSRFDQTHARRLSQYSSLILVCGHYEGIDERVRNFVDEEISIGDFVLTGGELAALVVSDAVCRLWPGVLGNDTSSVEESFSEGWLEYPQYTRPPEYRGMQVPEILLGGNHGAVEQWRRCESIRRTRERRPDLYASLEPTLTARERKWMNAEENEPQ
ncbi:MAG: tRNA (guanosine(37)-N1)-methyltransferase TrmD [Proteobacteria bacterium]|nr:tRNA (guanosine(37)-N1)-methyltransferase TrmD [Pseudomonadota bacterium]